jgi:hypothetical protein
MHPPCCIFPHNKSYSFFVFFYSIFIFVLQLMSADKEQKRSLIKQENKVQIIENIVENLVSNILYTLKR